MHQRICMAFPTDARRALDGAFLHPFRPEDFAAGQVKVARRSEAGFLFRVDPLPMGRAMILVQSAVAPDWDYAFHNARHLLAADPLVREHDPHLVAGQRCCFRLRANAVRRLPSPEPNRDGPRVPVPADRLVAWLQRRASGFELEGDPALTPGYVYMNKTGRPGDGLRLRSVRFDGFLTVTDSEALSRTLAAGIGPGKAFGFGLLSIAPV
ncbi:MAG: type I-E CRISPR-associated protein Cas6/Cse3/CasE [Phycisphaerales bacterium]|nr:type I-E CRISPR-associated protein Cas6/Cse3/CasE [Phycisphaerales bacterium]